jgi:hypothetical protein
MFSKTKSKIRKDCMIKNLKISVWLACTYFAHCSAQLIGHRGVFSLPPGEEYRYEETRPASDRVSAFARKFQPVIDLASELNKFDEQERTRQRYIRQPVFVTSQPPRYIQKMNADLFYYSETKDLDTDPVIRKRIMQDWVKKANGCVHKDQAKKPIIKIRDFKKPVRKVIRTKYNPRKEDRRRPLRRNFKPFQTYRKEPQNYLDMALPVYGRSG